MNYASLLVHVPESAHCASIIDTAAELSVDFDAYLTALHVYSPSYRGYVNSGAAPIWPTPASLNRHLEAAKQHDSDLRLEFEDRVKHLRHAKFDWRYQERLSSNGLAHTIAAHAQCADLVIMGQHDPGETPSEQTYGTPALVALLSARPTLILPYASRVRTLGRHVVVAWNASREATSAVTAALPLLARAGYGGYRGGG